MFRLFLLIVVFFYNSYGCESDFASCIAKLNDSNAIQNNTLAIPLENNQRLIYATKEPDAKIVRYDPFLSLYLVKDPHPFAYPFRMTTRHFKKSALLQNNCAYMGKITQHQRGLNHLAHYTQHTQSCAILTDGCCNLAGILTRNGLIEKEYIDHFLQQKTIQTFYGDIGIRVRDIKECVGVDAVDPFFRDNPFKQGDCVVRFDHTPISSAAQLMRLILFSPLQTHHNITIKRKNNQTKMFSLKIDKRYGGGMLSDTFLERKGVYFTPALRVIKVQAKKAAQIFKVRDQLLAIDDVAVSTQQEVQQCLQNKPAPHTFLLQRDGFQFFIHF